MNNQEAKFVLSSYRPNGRDAIDPQFADALAQASTDPALRSWFEREQAFDRTVAAKLDAITPPAGLRDAILAGGRASAPTHRWRTLPAWLAAAAAIAVLTALTLQFRKLPSASGPMHELAGFAIEDLANAHGDHEAHPAAFAVLQTQLARPVAPVTAQLHLDVADLRRKGCRAVSVGGREVFEICFKRDGTWFHVYVARRGDFPGAGSDAAAAVSSRGRYAATAWSDPQNVYALVTSAGSDALRRVL